ncbi:papain fold toxin domain-containing protein [Aquimarina sp. 2201CG1-2-11]|uniref:papain fold toxin domain-containing protein n=1 Tax=Aquimarina discodermiae TaxID=3231043 RepID=UPI0034620B2F
MKNSKIYVLFSLLMMLVFEVTAQEWYWLQSVNFNVGNANTLENVELGEGRLLSLQVIPKTQSNGYFEITNFKIAGKSVSGSTGNFMSILMYLSLDDQYANKYSLEIIPSRFSSNSEYTIIIKNPSGVVILEKEFLDYIFGDEVFRIEKTSDTSIKFTHNGVALKEINDPNLTSFRIGMVTKTPRRYDHRLEPPLLSFDYKHAGFGNSGEDVSYLPFEVEAKDKNWVLVNNYDVQGKFSTASVAFYDKLGKPIQSQSFDPKSTKTWATKTLYDAQGRPALQTLAAPIGHNPKFLYKDDFIKKPNGVIFNNYDFENDPENPLTVGAQPNSLGWYYSTQNTDEPYQDVTSRPYSRTIYSELNPGAALKTIGGNKIDGQWKNGYAFSMPAGEELSSATGDPKYRTYKIIKTVSRDIHGIENVVFTDTDGNTLASARSGNEEGNNTNRTASVQIGAQGFVDIHIPKGKTGVQLSGNGGLAIDIYDLITEQKTSTSSGNLSNGFYRIAVRDITTYAPRTVTVTYPENYYDYAINEYDKAGRLLTSKQPLKDSSGTQLTSTFDYNSFGQLETTVSPDEGQAWFRYRKDGQIRFSQNIKQQEHSPQEFSYTNYDRRGRPIESGVIENTTFTTANVDGDLPTGTRKEVHHTTYDRLANDDTFLNTLATTYQKPSFLAGNVAKTKNENTTTYYSYDIYGRVQWIVQQIAGLSDAKTIDYEYDPVSSQVTKVYFQKGHATEQFIHRYTYDAADYSLVKVETSTDDTTYTEHANYEYNETGGLKRIDIAQGLQGIDYVYNLQGALKSINHPSLQSANDPGGDTNDLFGMIIDYNEHDYNRPIKNIKSASYGANQYNGNIKGIRWNSDYNPIAGKEHTYSYDYNRNNWLTQASYGNFTPDNTSIPVIIDEEVIETPAATDHIPSVKSVLNTGQTQNLKANKSITMVPGFHAKPGSTFSATIVGSETIDYIRDINAGTFAVNTNGDYKVDNITYDANGNIQTLNRNKQTENGGSNMMDQLSYTYKEGKPNQLLRVDDAAGDVAGADDIGDQNGNNYEYNKIGQLVKNNEENIAYIYNASGLVTEIQKGNQPLVKFFYNDKGHRVRKEVYTPSNGSLSYTEHYVRDAAGTAMAIYRDGQVIENTIYGASRLGVRKSDGSHLYQLTDHLGNVRAVVGRSAQGQAMAMTSATDYYPFGMPMPGRNQVGDYRYAYQGQEKDPETGKEAFELRLWDSRIGRWLTTDPAGQYASPYMAMGNNPITRIDPDGGFDDTIYENANNGDTVEVNDGVNKTILVNDTQFQSAKFYASIINNQYARDLGFSKGFVDSYRDFFNSVNSFNSFGEAINDYFTFNLTPILPSRDPIALTAGGEVGEWVTPIGGGAKLGFAAFNKFGSKGWKIASKVASKFKIFQCVECTGSIVNSLKKANIKGEILEFTVTDGPKVIGAQVGDDFIQIATNGIHKAVHVEGLVFDNIFKNGVPLEVWKRAIEIAPSAQATLKVIKF